MLGLTLYTSSSTGPLRLKYCYNSLVVLNTTSEALQKDLNDNIAEDLKVVEYCPVGGKL